MGIRWTRDTTVLPGAVNSPASEQFAPWRYRPVWHVDKLVFQGGVPILKRSSITGGGFIPMKSLAGKEAPAWQPYVTRVGSILGGGVLPSRPPFTTALVNGQATGSGI